MAKYTSDTNLIKGAATAYKNWDNVPGMYAGLDKATKAGKEMLSEAITGIKKEKKEDERNKKIFNKLANDVYENLDGSFKTTADFDHARNELQSAEQDLYEALESKDQGLITAAYMKFNNLDEAIQSQKGVRKSISDPKFGMSNAVKGDNAKIVYAWLAEEYTKSTNKEGDFEYTMNIDGIGKVTKTVKDIEQIALLKNNLPHKAYKQQFEKYIKNRKQGGRNLLMYDIRENVVPKDADDLNVFLNDDGFAMSGMSFDKCMKNPDTKIAFSKEIDYSLYDTNNNPDDDYDELIDAIVNPNNDFWKTQGEGAWEETAREITIDLLTNATENAWKDIHVEKEVNKKGALNRKS